MTTQETISLEELITIKYKKLFEDVKNIIGDLSIFLEEEKKDNIDLLEITDLMLFLFPDTNTLYNLNEVLDLKYIVLKDEQKEKLLPIIDDFLIFLNKVKKFM